MEQEQQTAEGQQDSQSKKWYHSKTVWTGVGSVLAGVAGYATGTVETADAAQMVTLGLLGVFGRIGVMNN